MGEDTPTLTGVDFVSDERQPKRTARQMIVLTRRINSDLAAALGSTKDGGDRVRCATCHRGNARPVDASAASAAHPREYWRSIVEHAYAPPDEASVPELSMELSQLLGSPDPELRDEIAYATLAAWIYQKRLLGPGVIRTLTTEWTRSLQQGIDSPGTDAIFRRSFSALCLSVVVARDNAAPFLAPEEFRTLFTAAVEYLRAEQDLRAYDPETGWIHAVAHAADLLKFLGRSRYLTRKDQTVLLDTIATKLANASIVFTHGEDERLARAILSEINRPDFDREGFDAWVAQSKPTPVTVPRPAADQLRRTQNLKNLYTKLGILLSLDTQPSDSVRAARDALSAALKGLF